MYMIFKSTYRLIGVVTIVSVATVMGSCGESSDGPPSSEPPLGSVPTDYTNPWFSKSDCKTWYKTYGTDDVTRNCATQMCSYINCLHEACFMGQKRYYPGGCESNAQAAMGGKCLPHNQVVAQCMNN